MAKRKLNSTQLTLNGLFRILSLNVSVINNNAFQLCTIITSATLII